MVKSDLWHDIPTGERAPEVVYAVVEIPRGQRNKYEYSKTLGVMQLSRVLFSPMHYPGDYGFLPQTLGEDNDPLDILVMTTEPTFPGCVIEARPIGVFRMIDKDEADEKILAVPAADPLFGEYNSISDVPRHFLTEVDHFFKRYKELEGIEVITVGWEDAPVAREVITRAMQAYQKAHGQAGRRG